MQTFTSIASQPLQEAWSVGEDLYRVDTAIAHHLNKSLLTRVVGRFH